MGLILKARQTVFCRSSDVSVVIGSDIASGGQGEIYEASIDGKAVAVKWYKPKMASEMQKQNLVTLIKKGAPSPEFIWPIEIVNAKGKTGFGYIMPLLEPRFKSIPRLLTREINPSFRALSTAGFYLADSFIRLHTVGLCYKDINYGNVVFDPNNGDIRILDNDNVVIDGEMGSGEYGTQGFKAPELYHPEGRLSSFTDRYSLAVLLFYIFMIHHPLHGKKEADIRAFDDAAMDKLYGYEPIFIWDPNDKSNRPIPDYQDNAIIYWAIYPTFLRKMFTKSFTAGLRDPNARVMDGEWRQAMIRLRDAIFYCACGAENFYDSEALNKNNGKPGHCWNCNKTPKFPPRIRISDHVIMLNRNTQLFPHHIDHDRPWDFVHPVACITRNPMDPQKWGLQNLTSVKWVITYGDGTIKDVEPQKSASLNPNMKINFGKVEGEIRL